jgi:hypothetical protein
MLSVDAEKLDFLVQVLSCGMYSVSEFSRQPLTPFESRFNFPDRLNLHKLMERPKMFRRANRRRRYPRRLSSIRTVFLSFLCNHRPHLSPVSIFRTSATPLITGKGQKRFAAPIDDSDFESPLNRFSRPPLA